MTLYIKTLGMIVVWYHKKVWGKIFLSTKGSLRIEMVEMASRLLKWLGMGSMECEVEARYWLEDPKSQRVSGSFRGSHFPTRQIPENSLRVPLYRPAPYSQSLCIRSIHA